LISEHAKRAETHQSDDKKDDRAGRHPHHAHILFFFVILFCD